MFPNLTVAENIAFRHHVERPVRLNRKVMREQAQGVMDRLKVSLPLDELVGKLRLPRGNWWRYAGRWRRRRAWW